MIYIEKVTIRDKTHPGTGKLKRGFEFDCGHVVVFVGEQGCGKSTMLNLLQKNHSDLKIKFSDHVLKNGVKHYYLNTELDNPRIKHPQMFATPSGSDKGIGFGVALQSRFRSHGEVISDLIIKPLEKFRDCVVIIDEPENGLSITNQFKLIKAINKAVKNGCQVFIATHCYPSIQEFNVISLQHHKCMSGAEFIDKVKK